MHKAQRETGKYEAKTAKSGQEFALPEPGIQKFQLLMSLLWN
jgi:hypothetical protein